MTALQAWRYITGEPLPQFVQIVDEGNTKTTLCLLMLIQFPHLGFQCSLSLNLKSVYHIYWD